MGSSHSNKAALKKMPLKICLINPKFEPSFYGYEYAFEILPDSAKAKSISGALPLLAALVPDEHEVTILDENCSGEVDATSLQMFDIIGITGMIVQRKRMLDLLFSLKDLHATLVVGGPYVSVDEECFREHCNVMFIGEADSTWPEFIKAMANNRPFSKKYEQINRTDMSSLPTPRYGLLDNQDYMMASIQFSRGCPFQCEFCDIIILFGRQPRMKKPHQIIEELNKITKYGYRQCFIVDDNFIGNKKAAKELLRHIINWQQEHSYPIQLSTQASINLADDVELMKMFVEANIANVFIGIETPNEKALVETKKLQNIHGKSMFQRIHAIRHTGINIIGGFIVGFDSDDSTIFDNQFTFISEAKIGIAALTVLTAIPKTPLYTRLQEEGRLNLENPLCNFIPKLLTIEELESGYQKLAMKLYEPMMFFERVLESYQGLFVKNSTQGRSSFRSKYRVIINLLSACNRLGKKQFLLSYMIIFFRQKFKYPNKHYSLTTFLQLCAFQIHFYRIYTDSSKGKQGGIYSYVTHQDT